MKFAILFTIVVFATSSSAQEVKETWPGIAEDNTCGMEISQNVDFVNHTCTVTGSNIKHVYAGSGAFITGPNTFTGYDGISGLVHVVVFFSQTCQSGKCDSSTCYNASVSCLDEGGVEGTFFLDNVMDQHAKNGNYNLQISGVSTGSTLNIHLKNENSEGVGVQNITATDGEIFNATEDAWGNLYSDNGQFSVQVDNEDFGQLFQISVVRKSEKSLPSMWKSSVEMLK